MIVDVTNATTDIAYSVSSSNIPVESATGGRAFLEARSYLYTSVFLARFSSLDLEGYPCLFLPILGMTVNKLKVIVIKPRQ